MTTLPLTEHKRAVIRAWLDGQTIQIKPKRSAKFSDWKNSVPAVFCEPDDHYRIKPNPTRRFWRPEEIPVGWQVRNTTNKQLGIIAGVTSTGEACTVGYVASVKPENFMFFEVAPPGPANAVQWQPAGVEVNVDEQ